jgi:hypothetical protein
MKNKLILLATSRLRLLTLLAGALLTTLQSASADPLLTSWFTSYSSQYARIYATTAAETSGTPATTWSNGSETQALPAYDGVQEVDYSSDWVYVRSTGLGSHVMGPWYLDAAKTTIFPNLPVNLKMLYRIPRAPVAATSENVNGGGIIGIFVDGVSMFNSWDAFYWNGSADVSGAGSAGSWNRDAYVNEGLSFDPACAHQQNTGTYHYHASPVALRYLLGDHVTYNAAANSYAESTNTVAQHSPILAWVGDGYPLYGPYGYSNALAPTSGLRRMVSGYVPRNGLYGTANLSTNGALRSTIPLWAQRAYSTNAAESGPAVSTSYPFGRYMEDNDYLGDHGYTQGVDFDLDEHNGRYCVTPDFPNGTYAYFVAIAADGTPVFPYNIGRAYYGNPTGASVSAITETVVTNFLGNTNLVETLGSPGVNNGTVTLAWSAVEGGSYQVQSTTNLSTWNTIATNLSPNKISGGYTNHNSLAYAFYRVERTTVAAFDPVSAATGTGAVAPGGSATQGETVTVTITLPTSPPLPPGNNVPTSITLAGTISGTGLARPTSGTAQATFTIPANAPTGSQNIVVTFNPAPTYTMTGAFTITP